MDDKKKKILIGGGAVLAIVALVLLIKFMGPGAAEDRPKGRDSSKDMVLDLGGGVSMAFIWVEQVNGWVAKYEVANEEYRRFKPEHDSQSYNEITLNHARQPVVYVNYEEAEAYATWVAQRPGVPEGYKVSLPGRHVWLMFAQCGDDRAYPWGNEWPPPSAFNYHRDDGAGDWNKFEGQDGHPVTCNVEDSGMNPWGLYGVAGNVLEWTTQRLRTSRGGQVLRGAAWSHFSPEVLKCGKLFAAHPSERLFDRGLRLCILVDESAAPPETPTGVMQPQRVK